MTTTEETATAEQPAADQAPAEMPVRPAAALAVRGADPSRTLTAKIQYAKALAESGLLPAIYRRQPANVLFAIEYGDMLGLPPVAAMLGIYVIDGKPAAYASLISALVRKAGHKLRVGYDAATMTGWAEIVRRDDPGYTFRSEWDLDRAVMAELCTIRDGQPHALDSKGRSLPWRKFFPSMTKARAITEVARDACEEALYGLHYTPEELGAQVDENGVVVGEIVPDSAGPAWNGVQAENPGGDPWSVRSEEGTAWLAEAVNRAASFADLDAGRELWKETAARLRDGSIVKADADHLAALLKARNEELVAADAEVLEGTVVEQADLDPEDPWAARIADIATAEEADAVMTELGEVARESEMLAADHARIAQAIEVRVAELDAEAAA